MGVVGLDSTGVPNDNENEDEQIVIIFFLPLPPPNKVCIVVVCPFPRRAARSQGWQQIEARQVVSPLCPLSLSTYLPSCSPISI